MRQFKRKRIGEILLEKGFISPEQNERILSELTSKKEALGKVAVTEGFIQEEYYGEVALRAGFITEGNLAEALAEQFMLPYVNLENFEIDKEVLGLVPEGLLDRYRFVPYARKDNGLAIVIDDPLDVHTLDEIEAHLGLPLIPMMGAKNAIDRVLKKMEGSLQVLEEVSEDFKLDLVKETERGEEILTVESVTADTRPVVRLIDSTLFDAINRRASDIHIETQNSGVFIKYRIDGLLYPATKPIDLRFHEPIISRLKVMSELDISERRVPQDGRFKVRLKDKSIDFRVSIMPSAFGEDAVLRILDKESMHAELGKLSLDALGFTPKILELFREAIRKPYGMVLVTGPTGSGKTTTLYGALTEINSGEDKIITIEDPVEYLLSNVTQVPVNEKKGLTFARGLRSVLRHDPDKIMVGEIRDTETAEIAIQSALTGHLVFSTVHANNALDVIGRFVHMKIDPYNFVSSLNCVMAQRLVRTLCKHCRAPYKPGGEVLKKLGLDPVKYGRHSFYGVKGCGECNDSGYKGRAAIAELLILNDEIRELIVAKSPFSTLKEAARKTGTTFLREGALERLCSGETSLEEINRVTFSE